MQTPWWCYMLLPWVLLSQHIWRLGQLANKNTFQLGCFRFDVHPSPFPSWWRAAACDFWCQLRMVFSFAGISCLQAMSYATLPFAEEKNTFCFVCFSWRNMWTFIGKLFFLRFLARSFPVSSFEITGSKLYRSFRVPCLPWAHVPPWKERLDLGTSQGLSVERFLKGTKYWPTALIWPNFQCKILLWIGCCCF